MANINIKARMDVRMAPKKPDDPDTTSIDMTLRRGATWPLTCTITDFDSVAQIWLILNQPSTRKGSLVVTAFEYFIDPDAKTTYPCNTEYYARTVDLKSKSGYKFTYAGVITKEDGDVIPDGYYIMTDSESDMTIENDNWQFDSNCSFSDDNNTLEYDLPSEITGTYFVATEDGFEDTECVQFEVSTKNKTDKSYSISIQPEKTIKVVETLFSQEMYE